MKKFRFENTSKEAITEVLQRYEKVQFQKMIENAGYSMPKKLANFKLIKEFRTCAVNYKYPGEREYSQLFVIKDYEMPAEGWIWTMYND